MTVRRGRQIQSPRSLANTCRLLAGMVMRGVRQAVHGRPVGAHAARVALHPGVGEVVVYTTGCWIASIPARRSGGYAGLLANLDQVAVGVAQVAADLAAVDLGWGEELGPPGAPLLVGGLDIGHPEIEEGAGASGVGRWFQDDLGLVIGRSSTDVDDHPAVGQLDDRWLAVQHDLTAEHAG